VKLLLDRGADPNASDSIGVTPLHAAAANGHADVVKLLLEREADPSIRHKGGKTPLDLAVEYGHHETLQILTSRRGSRRRKAKLA
jgi:ankyrin repeat protein